MTAVAIPYTRKYGRWLHSEKPTEYCILRTSVVIRRDCLTPRNNARRDGLSEEEIFEVYKYLLWQSNSMSYQKSI